SLLCHPPFVASSQVSLSESLSLLETRVDPTRLLLLLELEGVDKLSALSSSSLNSQEETSDKLSAYNSEIISSLFKHFPLALYRAMRICLKQRGPLTTKFMFPEHGMRGKMRRVNFTRSHVIVNHPYNGQRMSEVESSPTKFRVT
ncbi:hypothetical protein C0J52_01069, partial [Blattella germanica]